MEENNNSQTTFESLNLNPQLLINEAFNLVDDCLDGAFHYFLKESSEVLKIDEDSDRHAELTEGVECVKKLVQLNLDQRLQQWADYCLHYCFHVPDDFSLPKNNEASTNDLAVPDSLADTHLDSELQSLREKLALVRKETAQLDREVHALEKQSLSSNQFAGSIDEVLKLYKTHDTSQAFQELVTLAPEFRSKLMNLKRKMVDDTRRARADKIRMTNADMSWTHIAKGLGGKKPEELEEFLDGLMRTH